MTSIAVLGAGRWGPNLIRNFHDAPDCTVRWVVDTDPSRLEMTKRVFPSVRVGEDATLAVADPEVDAVVVATPTVTHEVLVRLALESGKHVLVEKPLTHQLESSRRLEALAAERGLVLMVGHVFLFNAGVRWVKEYIDSGELGRVYYVAMQRTNLGPIRFDVNAAWDLASHDISIVNYWLDAEPIEVSAVGGTWINAGIHDAVFATLRYEGNVLVNMHASWLNPLKARGITIVGDKRMLTFDDMNTLEPARVYDKQVAETTTKPGFIDTIASFRSSVRSGNVVIPPIAMGEPLKSECLHFLDCVRRGVRCESDARFAVGVVGALEALERSLASHGRMERVATTGGA